VIVEMKIPALTRFSNGFPTFWLSQLFSGHHSTNFQERAVIATYMRLVEGWCVYYEYGRRHAEGIWREGIGIPMGGINLTATYFESCITSMHRAVLCMRRIRGGVGREELVRVFRTKLDFVNDKVANRLRDMRDSIQHTDGQILDGAIPENTPFALTVTGPEVPVADPKQRGQTLKTIDRLVLGDNELLFAELATWLNEMGECAEIISNFKGPN